MSRQSLYLKPPTSLTTRVIILLLLNLSSFQQMASAQPMASPQDQREQFLREAKENHLKRIQALGQMDQPHLLAELSRESLDGTVPSNSSAYKEVLRRGPDFAPPLASLLKVPDRSSFLALLALRKISPAEYKKLSADFRVRVLVDSLEHAKSFNAWGLPQLAWEEAAKALIDEKEGTRAALAALLAKNSPDAPVVGLRSSDANKKYRYRLSDYALALLNEINNQRIVLPKDPAIRDGLIEELATRRGFPKPHAPIEDREAPVSPEGLGVR